nr:hypothetical protein [Clostridia bacterium]
MFGIDKPNPMAFVENLKWMGIGMLGVIMIVFIIMLATYAISFVMNRLELVRQLDAEKNESGEE